MLSSDVHRRFIGLFLALATASAGCSTGAGTPDSAVRDASAEPDGAADALVPQPDGSRDAAVERDEGPADAGGERCEDPSEFPCYLPFDPPSRETLRGAARQVYAHWHWFDLKINDRAADEDYYNGWLGPDWEGARYADVGGYLKERPLPRPPRNSESFREEDARQDIAWARQMGLDGFIVNMWNDPARYERSWSALLDAADEAGDFDIIASPDFAIMASLSASDAEAAVLQIIQWLAAHPSAKRVDGRLVISPFFPENAPGGMEESHRFWETVLDAAASTLGEEIYFVPVFLGTRDLRSYDEISDGVGGWNTAIEGELDDVQGLVEQVGARDKFYMATINTQDSRPSRGAYWESSQTGALRVDAEGAVRSRAPWVQIATWNDHAEHHAVRPATGKQWATFDMLTYYTAWLKSDGPPPIVRDVLYYSHRVHHTDAPYDTDLQTTTYTNRVRDPENQIELVAFLRAGGTLEIEFGGETVRQEVGAGIQVLRAPLRPGVEGAPVFRLRRDDRTVIELTSEFPVRASVTYQDLLYRSGGSARSALGESISCEAICETGDVDACWGCPAEPVWRINR